MGLGGVHLILCPLVTTSPVTVDKSENLNEDSQAWYTQSHPWLTLHSHFHSQTLATAARWW